jgi:flagellar biosynthesis regulator FlbT
MKKKIKKAKKPVEKIYKNVCMRCEKQFTSKAALKAHSKSHLQALNDIKMLEEGHVPIETKFGSEFKGKNKIIVA